MEFLYALAFSKASFTGSTGPGSGSGGFCEEGFGDSALEELRESETLNGEALEEIRVAGFLVREDSHEC